MKSPIRNLGIGLFLLLLFACNLHEKHQETMSDKDVVYAFIKENKSTIVENTDSFKMALLACQSQLTDSLQYFVLTRFYAQALYYQFQLDSAILVDKSIIEFIEKQQESPDTNELLSQTYNDLGVFYSDLGQRDSAIHYLTAAVDVPNLSMNKERYIDIYINLGDNHKQNTNFTLAADCYRTAMLFADSLQLSEHYTEPILSGLGTVYNDLNNFELADYYFTLAEANFDLLPAHEKLHFAIARGNHFFFSEDYEQALRWFRQTHKLAQTHNRAYYQALSEINIAEVFMSLNQLDSAQIYLDTAHRFFNTIHAMPDVKFYIHGLYASLYLQKNNLAKAEYYLSIPYDSAAIIKQYINQHHKRLEEFYAKKGDFKQAYKYAQQVNVFDKENRNIMLQRNIEEINHRYSKDTTLLHKNLQLQKQQQALMKSDNRLIIISIVFLLAIFIFLSIAMILKRRREQQFAKQVDLITQLRMENIKNRMSPHFIFNALNSLMPNIREHPALNEPVKNLIDAIRQSLTVSDSLMVTLQEELEQVNSYINLLKSLNYSLPIVRFDIDERISLDSLIPAMCVQIPFENSIKYAFEEISEGDFIQINIKNVSDKIYISIKDNGMGFSAQWEDEKSNGTGSGFKILHKTMALLNARSSEKIDFQVIDKHRVNTQSQGVLVQTIVPENYIFKPITTL